MLEVLERPEGNPFVAEVMTLHRRMMKLVPQLKAQHGKRDLFSTRVYGPLVTQAGSPPKRWDSSRPTRAIDQGSRH